MKKIAILFLLCSIVTSCGVKDATQTETQDNQGASTNATSLPSANNGGGGEGGVQSGERK